MNTETALTVRQLTPSTWSMIEAVAPAMHQSRLFGVASADQAKAIMLKGFELGLSLTASFEFVTIIQGKPTLIPRGALALIYQSGELAEIKITEIPDGCTVYMKRTNGVEYETTWTIDDAKRAGLVKAGGAWEAYPKNMARWRAIGFVADVVFPDLLGGMKRADELGAAVNSSGDVIEGEWSVQPVSTQPAVDTVSTNGRSITLDELVARYGAEKVFAACSGKLPETQLEVDAALARIEVFA